MQSPAAHVIPVEACAGAWNLWAAGYRIRTLSDASTGIDPMPLPTGLTQG